MIGEHKLFLAVEASFDIVFAESPAGSIEDCRRNLDALFFFFTDFSLVRMILIKIKEVTYVVFFTVLNLTNVNLLGLDDDIVTNVELLAHFCGSRSLEF